MIKFKLLEKGKAKELSAKLAEGFSHLYNDIFEIVESFSDFLEEEGCSFGFCLVDSSLAIRIFDGENYVFVYPIALTDDADDMAAVEEIRKYAVKEEIPLIFCDVPSESVGSLEEYFRFTETYEDGEAYTVKIVSELSKIFEVSELFDGELSLGELKESDRDKFAEISLDVELNKYWGYDYRDDLQDPTPQYFIDSALEGFDLGISASFAVRLCGEFVGEVCFWGFDLFGGCELGFRLHANYRGKGYGKRILSLAIRMGEEIGLLRLYASVIRDNTPSVSVVERQMEFVEQQENVNKYVHKYQ